MKEVLTDLVSITENNHEHADNQEDLRSFILNGRHFAQPLI